MKTHELQIDHLAFPSFDPEETWRFYTEVMRLPLIGASSNGNTDPWLMTRFGLADGRQLVFFTVRNMERPRDDGSPDWLFHYAFSAASAEAMQDWRDRLRKLGVKFSEEDHDQQQSIYFSDPNGLLLEVIYPASSLPPPAGTDKALQHMREWTRMHL